MASSLAAHLLDHYPYLGSVFFKECHDGHAGIWGALTSVCNAKHPISAILRAERRNSLYGDFTEQFLS